MPCHPVHLICERERFLLEAHAVARFGSDPGRVG
jgi:hypothetical protein